MAVELQTPGVSKTRELIELFEKYGIKVGTKVGNVSRLAGVYGIKRPKEVKVQYTGQSPTTIKNPTQFYVKPTDSQLKQIKKQYDINQLKRTEGGPGKEAFEKRNKRAKQLLKTGKYTIGQANEKLKSEFPEIKKTGIQKSISPFFSLYGGELSSSYNSNKFRLLDSEDFINSTDSSHNDLKLESFLGWPNS